MKDDLEREDYSDEFGKPWNNKYWEDGKRKSTPTKEDNYFGEGYKKFGEMNKIDLAEKLIILLKKKPFFENAVISKNNDSNIIYILKKKSLEEKTKKDKKKQK